MSLHEYLLEKPSVVTSRDYEMKFINSTTPEMIYSIVDIAGVDREAPLRLVADGVLLEATVIFFLEALTSAEGPRPVYASCSIDTLFQGVEGGGQDERVVALSASARAAAKVSPPSDDYIDGVDVYLKTKAGAWLTTATS